MIHYIIVQWGWKMKVLLIALFQLLLFILFLSSCLIAHEGAMIKAHEAYRKGDCGNTLFYLSSAERYQQPTPKIQAEISFMRASCFEEQGKIAEAKAGYEYVAKHFQTSEYAHLARAKLKNSDSEPAVKTITMQRAQVNSEPPVKTITMQRAQVNPQAQVNVTSPPVERRTALVIGNARYKNTPLKNPQNDAREMAATLKSQGFSVTLKLDANQEEMEEAISDFGRKLVEGGVGLFYYAGHGVQVDGKNYLIPIGATIKRQKDVRYKAVNANQILDEMGYARNGLNIVIFDACRDNPLPRSFRSGKRGLARIEGPKGTLIAFATSPGSVAADGAGQNGTYTKYLLQHMKVQGLPVEQVFKRVLKDVNKETNGEQTPWVSSSFMGDFYFAGK